MGGAEIPPKNTDRDVPGLKTMANSLRDREVILELSKMFASMRKSGSRGMIFTMRFTMGFVMSDTHTIRSRRHSLKTGNQKIGAIHTLESLTVASLVVPARARSSKWLRSDR